MYVLRCSFQGFIALQASAENIVGALNTLSLNSTFPCFTGKQATAIMDKLRARFRTELSAPVGHVVTNDFYHLIDTFGFI